MTLPICIRFNKEQKIDNADFYIAQNDLADFVSDFNRARIDNADFYIAQK